MLFNSNQFILVFLPTVIIGFYFLRRLSLFQISLGWITLSSLFFYAWWNPSYLLLLLSSITANFFLGIAVANSRYRKLALILGISGNLLAIGFYKYLGFFVASISAVSDLHITIPSLLLPLAISFFTFQQIAYLVDTYHNRNPETRFDRYLLFVSFFPQLIAGPIVHHKQVAPQFDFLEARAVSLDQISSGVLLFAIGLAKKVLIADQLAPYATPVFHAADNGVGPTFLEAWGGLLAYTFQLYFDFSGYADMAVGLARMFGIELPLNFNSPYKSKNIIEFWRRWHITLSHFLRDYLYIPLGGNKRGSKNSNLIITMLLGGLWHGAGWNFIIWGGLHGAYLVANHYWLNIKALAFAKIQLSYGSAASYLLFRRQAQNNELPKPVRRNGFNHSLFTVLSAAPGIAITFFAVSIAWIFFRAETFDGAINMLSGVFGVNGLIVPSQIFNIAPAFFSTFSQAGTGSAIGSFPHVYGFVVIAISMLFTFFLPNSNEITHWLGKSDASSSRVWTAGRVKATYVAGLGVAFIMCLKLIAYSPDSEFLYFNF